MAEHGAAGQRVAALLRDRILSGAYAPGQRIRQEDVAERLGASRFPVRDALRILEAEGLVTLVANKGATVSRLSLDECNEMYSIRERLEPLLLRINVPALTPADVDRLESLATRMEHSTDVDEFLGLDRDFHMSPLTLVPTRVLHDTVQSLWNRTQHYRRAATGLLSTAGDRSVHHDHHLIVHALRRGDEVGADHALASHIRRSRLELSRHPAIFED